MLIADHGNRLVPVDEDRIDEITIVTGAADPWFIDYFFILVIGGDEVIAPIESGNGNYGKVLAFAVSKGVDRGTLKHLANEIHPARETWWRRHAAG